MKVRIPKNQNNYNNAIVEPCVSVEFDDPVTHGENLLAIMLLHIAHTQPEVIERHQMITASSLTFPNEIVAQICGISIQEARNTIPNEVFCRVIQKLITGRLIASFMTETISYPYLPVTLFDLAGEPAIMFDEGMRPQWYYTQEHQGGMITYQLRLYGDLRERFGKEAAEWRRLRGL